MKLGRAIKKGVFWTHLVGGIAAGLVIFLLAATGVLLSFERQILEWLDEPKVAEIPNQPAMLLEDLVGASIAKHPELSFSSVNLKADPKAAVGVSFGREKSVNLNPYNGEDLGQGSPRLHEAFHWITGLHRWLALSEVNRDTGKLITGIANLFFLFLIVSGLYLWWPGRWTWHFLKRIVWFDRRLTKRAKDWNWHNVFGFWCCVPLLLIVLTGTIMAFGWANQLLFALTGNEPPPPRTGRRGGGGQMAVKPSAPKIEGLNEALLIAQNKVPDWKSISIRLGDKPGAPASFLISQSHRGRPDKRAQLDVDLATGEEKLWEPFSSYNLGRQLRLWTRWVHTGEAGGWIGQTIAALAAMGAMVLVWTGFSMSWQRFRRRRS
ncbi:PepSY domain-containing protein [Phragmitibacter flavus]|uniref:PepSY domain-containing protein n=1 Tax=Phragmitibacter flavus TaxID=2576071 RepID=A0A5R8KHM2_9BACT|nr:PepSY-associated TM helix domain-containing protein [Phragmitibacter flavus]TLD71109.1 PepSY domain-containing protein [Phragmitibacter flavus]